MEQKQFPTNKWLNYANAAFGLPSHYSQTNHCQPTIGQIQRFRPQHRGRVFLAGCEPSTFINCDFTVGHSLACSSKFTGDDVAPPEEIKCLCPVVHIAKAGHNARHLSRNKMLRDATSSVET